MSRVPLGSNVQSGPGSFIPPSWNLDMPDQFGVTAYPTLILLDESGRILWRGEGLDDKNLRSLDFEIKKRLVR